MKNKAVSIVIAIVCFVGAAAAIYYYMSNRPTPPGENAPQAEMVPTPAE